jgi:heterodisulfide reductase subunit B2
VGSGVRPLELLARSSAVPAGSNLLFVVSRAATGGRQFIAARVSTRRACARHLGDEESAVQLSYFPGCSLHATAREYDASTRAVCAELDISLRELNGWNCCGSTSAHSVDAAAAHAMPLRNLTLAEESGLDVMSPCAACYGRMRAAQQQVSNPSADTPAIEVRHILDVLGADAAVGRLREKVTAPLSDLRVVSYYGCLTTRPPERTGAENVENPDSMDRLVQLAGAEALPWSYKTDCCGASLTLTRTDIVTRLVDRLLRMAVEAGADCVVVACSMCHANLDARQAEAAAEHGGEYELPIFYISELLGLAMGRPEAQRWWRRHLTDPTPLLKAKGFAA